MIHTHAHAYKKIIVIDDNVGILFSTKEALKFKDYDVLTFETYIGIDNIISIAPDLIFFGYIWIYFGYIYKSSNKP